MRRRTYLSILSLLLVFTLIGTGCFSGASSEDLMSGIFRQKSGITEITDTQNAAATDFAIRLFQACETSGTNTLISPLSVLCALAMTTNGARGETLAEMEAVQGMPAEEMSSYLRSYTSRLPREYLKLANAVWFTSDDRFTVNRDFLQTNADYFGADIYRAPLDEKACEDINRWISDKTDGMIPQILDEIPPEAVMYLVNALVFDGKWEKKYEQENVCSGEFTKEDGTNQNAEFMRSTESLYLEDENATGFMKYYKGESFAFVALLPNEGISVSDYIASLNGEKLHAMLASPREITLAASLPKFETGFETEMSAVLEDMGMPQAFNANQADLSGLGTSSAGNIFINRVLHKTFINVDEGGTKAGSAAFFQLMDKAEAMPDHSVILDRPFVYMLIDCENQIPFFIGTMMDIEA